MPSKIFDMEDSRKSSQFLMMRIAYRSTLFILWTVEGACFCRIDEDVPRYSELGHEINF
jgi:hypothetical protein